MDSIGGGAEQFCEQWVLDDTAAGRVRVAQRITRFERAEGPRVQFGPIAEEEFDPDRFLDGPQVAEFSKSDEESRSNSTETTMHGSGGSVERRVHDWNQVVAYSVRTPNRVHVAAGQYLYCTSPSTSPRATKPIVRLSRELFRLSPSTKHIPSGTFALG